MPSQGECISTSNSQDSCSASSLAELFCTKNGELILLMIDISHYSSLYNDISLQNRIEDGAGLFIDFTYFHIKFCVFIGCGVSCGANEILFITLHNQQILSCLYSCLGLL